MFVRGEKSALLNESDNRFLITHTAFIGRNFSTYFTVDERKINFSECQLLNCDSSLQSECISNYIAAILKQTKRKKLRKLLFK